MNLLFFNVGSFEILFVLLVPIIFLISIIYHVVNNKNLTYNQKLLWVIVMLVGNIFGALIYWIWGRKPKNIEHSY
ncbi:MAG TPA: PLDc N-terminal domain-containing protein [Candidatus Sphingobacterium stercorigallinarum]|nr:PLDc N-terminal domain-containing protein [Candidatus Sphingobacterium stercorigallinarum]